MMIEVPGDVGVWLAAGAEVLALLLVQSEVCAEKVTPSFWA
jgi:hypothetical protein